jgi:hypothetical protein
MISSSIKALKIAQAYDAFLLGWHLTCSLVFGSEDMEFGVSSFY